MYITGYEMEMGKQTTLIKLLYPVVGSYSGINNHC